MEHTQDIAPHRQNVARTSVDVEAGAVSAPRLAAARLTELDGLRGFLLLLMTVNHMPSPLRLWTSEPLGFTSAAEGFVFLSAFVCALVFHRRSQKIGVEGARQALLKRAGVVLRAHFITFALVFAVVGLWLAREIPAFYNMIWPIVRNPGEAALMGTLLVYQPPILDILPLYVILLAITPLCFWIAERWGWRWLLGGSALLWAVSQRPPIKLKLLDWSHLGHPWDFGAFDQFAWQFIWVLGLALGTWFFRKPADKPLVDFTKAAPRWIAGICVVPIIYLFLAGHELVSFNLDSWWWLLDKWRLGPLRMISFVLTLGLFIALAPVLAVIGRWNFLTILGRNSLPVFCSHICLALLTVGFSEHYQWPDSWCYLAVAGAVVLLYLTAGASELPIWKLAWWQDFARKQRVASR